MGLVMIPVILLAALIGLIFGNIPLWKYARKLHRKFSEAAGKDPRWGLFYLSMIPAACLMLAIFVTPFVFFLQGTSGGAPTGDSLIIIVLSFFVFGLAPGFGLILAAFGWHILRNIGVPDWVTGTAVVIAIFAVLYVLSSFGGPAPERSLVSAARAGNVGLIRRMIDDGADVNEVGEKNTTALIAAAKRSDGAVEVLITAGADVNLQDSFGTTPLIAAAGISHRAVELLIAAGADVNAADSAGVTPLIKATRDSFGTMDAIVALESTNRLLAAGADVNARADSGETALINAVKSGRADIVERLLAAGADWRLKGESNWTALLIAERYRYYDIQQMLKQAGAEH